MNIYNNDGWLDIPAIRRASPEAVFYCLVGDRRCGKTYGTFDFVHSTGQPWVYLRNTQDEVTYSISKRANLFVEEGYPWSADMRIEEGKPTMIYDNNIDDGLSNAGMALALCDLGKMRGFGARKTQHIIFDEFIPLQNSYHVPGAANKLLDIYTTINSNRELLGEPPVLLWLLANSNSLQDDILGTLGIDRVLIRMIRKGQSFCYLPDRRLCVVYAAGSPVGKKMRKTALYQLIDDGSDYARMATASDFVQDDLIGVGSRPIMEYTPEFVVDGLTFFKHKSRLEWYVAENSIQCKDVFDTSNPTHKAAFISRWRYNGLVLPVDGSNIYYSSLPAKLKTYRLLKLNKL